jgi:hypothetical protein
MKHETGRGCRTSLTYGDAGSEVSCSQQSWRW